MWRPRIEVPQFTRCCLCLPLRYGLLGMAYAKLALICYASIMVTGAVIYELSYVRTYPRNISFFVVPILIAIATYIDIGFTTAFIVAGHMKHRRGVLVYYYYTMAITVIYVVATITAFGIALSYTRNLYIYVLVYYVQDMVVVVSATLVQIYLTLLLRSEYKKLSNPTNFRFVNNAEERTATDKSDGEAILREEQEDTESRIEEIGLE